MGDGRWGCGGGVGERWRDDGTAVGWRQAFWARFFFCSTAPTRQRATRIEEQMGGGLTPTRVCALPGREREMEPGGRAAPTKGKKVVVASPCFDPFEFLRSPPFAAPLAQEPQHAARRSSARNRRPPSSPSESDWARVAGESEERESERRRGREPPKAPFLLSPLPRAFNARARS